VNVGTNDIATYSVTEVLRDGRPVTIRAVRPDDKGLVIDAIQNVSAESLYRRFLTTKRELTPQGLKLVTEVDFVDVVALVAVLEEGGKERIAGGGRYVRIGSSGTGQKAEVAFLIEDAFQGFGIASRLFRHLAAIARGAGITEFEAEVLPSNNAMLKVFTRSGLPIARSATSDSVHVIMDLTGESAGPSKAKSHKKEKEGEG
jgi:GNAT superfamily N-acetyltransferase